MASDLDRLRKTREILADPNHWTQGGYASRIPLRTAAVPINSEVFDKFGVAIGLGTCFCLLGAWAKAGPNADGRGTEAPSHTKVGDLLIDCLPPQYVKEYPSVGPDVLVESEVFREANVVGFNDEPDRKHEEVLAVLDCAINKLETVA